MQYLRITLFLSIILFIFFGGHALIYMTIKRFLPALQPAVLMGIKWAFVCFPILFFMASLIGFRYNNPLSRTLYATSAIWLGFAYFFLGASMLIWLFYGITRMTSLPLTMQWVAGILFVAAFCIGIYGVIHATNPRMTGVAITIPHLPDQWKGKTIVWISDVHLGQIYGEAFSKKIALMIQREKPDIIVIGGDLYDGSAVDLDAVIKPFAELTAPQGIYFITGNHEEFDASARFTDAVHRAGIRILNNESVILDGLQLLGVDFKDSEENQDVYRKTLANMNQAYPTILLKHAPDNVELTKQYPIALQLSGHTHHGQVWPLGYISSRVFHGFDRGLKQVDNLQIYTSMGVGTWGPPFRVGTTPEITLITVH